MKLKKIPRYLALSLLTTGASLILGFLSFGGMLALWPVLSLASAAFALSVAYEGEVYFQNIKGALSKLFKSNSVKQHLAKQYLLAHFPDECGLIEMLDNPEEVSADHLRGLLKNKRAYVLYGSKIYYVDKDFKPQALAIKNADELAVMFSGKGNVLREASGKDIKKITALTGHILPDPDDGPLFFKDYQRQLRLLEPYTHESLDKASRSRKKKIEKTLSDMEKWFATQLFPETKMGSNPLSAYEIELRTWLGQHEQREWLTKYNQRKTWLNWTKAFSATAGIFMGLGTTYLLSEAFTVIPTFAALSLTTLPLLIVPMALVAGAAYGLLTYNAITDMINNQTLRTWYNKIIKDWNNGRWFIPLCGVVLAGLAVVLTICTAGTWWTVAKEAPPLFKWLGKMPRFVMGIINPIITSISAIAFNLQNTGESLEIIDEFTHKKGNIFSRIGKGIAAGIKFLRSHENWLQIVNPFRIALKLTFLPLRILLFLGHLISIGVTTDRVPGISQFKSALLGMFIEGLEDMHYFVSHTHHHHHHGKVPFRHLLSEHLAREHSHNHELDFPARILTYIFSPLFALAALWDMLASRLNQDRPVLSFAQAWNKQHGIAPEKQVETDNTAQYPSANWQYNQTIYRIEHFKERQLDHARWNRPLAEQKGANFKVIQDKLREQAPDLDTDKSATAGIADVDVVEKLIKETIVQHKAPILAQHRFYHRGQDKTSSSRFIEEELPQRISVAVS